MKTFLSLVAVAATLVLNACSKKEDSNVLIIGTSGDNPPFEYYENGQLTGFDIELGKLIAQKLGREVKFVDMSFDSIIGALQAKKVDMAMSAICPTPERAKHIDLSEMYVLSTSVLVTPGLTTIEDVKTMDGKKIGVQLGSTYEEYGKKVLPKFVTVQLSSLNKVTDLIQELRNERIAGLITGVAEADKILELNPSFKAIKLPESTAGYAVALPKGSSLTKPVNEILQTLQADQSLQDLQDKWKLN